MVGQEVGIYGVFIWINNDPCITWPSSLDILNTLGHFNFVLLLFRHKTIPLKGVEIFSRGRRVDFRGESLTSTWLYRPHFFLLY